ncbi:MAG: S41 family peptidase [Acidobacteriota bacterium]
MLDKLSTEFTPRVYAHRRRWTQSGLSPIALGLTAALVALVATGCAPTTGSVDSADAPESAAEPTVQGADPEPAAATFTPEQLREDFTTLYGQLEEAHFNLYVHASKADYDARFKADLAALDRPLDSFETATTFQRFMAFGRIGHARIDTPSGAYGDYRAGGGTAPPFFFRVIDGRVLVTESYAAPGQEPALRAGDEILTLDGQPMSSWLERLRGHISAESAYMADSLLEFWFPRLLWLEDGERASYTLEIRGADAEAPRTVTAAALTQEQIRSGSADAPERLALDWNARSARMLDGDVAYLRPGPFYEPESAGGYDPEAFQTFLDESFADFFAADAGALIVDLRDNPGGDNSFSDRMVAYFADGRFRFCSAFRIKVSAQTRASHGARLELNPHLADDSPGSFSDLYANNPDGAVVDFEIPWNEPREGRRFEGEVYVLINRHSFSNAVTVAALIQDFEFGTVIGEPTSDLATSYGAMEQFTLPHTGIKVGYPKAHLVRPNGDERLRGVTPDIAIKTPLIQGPEDPVLREALALVTARRR